MADFNTLMIDIPFYTVLRFQRFNCKEKEQISQASKFFMVKYAPELFFVLIVVKQQTIEDFKVSQFHIAEGQPHPSRAMCWRHLISIPVEANFELQ